MRSGGAGLVWADRVARYGDWRLAPGDVHVWRISLQQPMVVRSTCRSLLSDEEAARANRFRFPRDRDSFVVAHGAVRQILGRYLANAPEQIRINTTEHGKPELACGSHAPPLRFNLSHSARLAVLAVTATAAVGVDIEHHRADLAGMEIADRFFSSSEAAVLRAMLPTDMVRGFFDCWTRKEAYIKAHGLGLSISLDSFEVGFGPDVAPSLVRVNHHPEELARWTLYDLMPASHYSGALVVEGRDHRIRCCEWHVEEFDQERERGQQRATDRQRRARL